MKRLILILFLIPTLVFGAFTEFYCDFTNGSNMNGGSNAGAVHFTQTNGNWSTVTNNFTVTNGHNAVSDGVVVGDFASVFLDGATTPVYIARVTAVQNATNGTITLSATIVAGSAPTTGATGRSINVGGRWKGPNAAVGFPFAISGSTLTAGIHNLQDSSSNRVRVNLKNNATYAITASIASGWDTSGYTIQGYSSTVGDGGKATIDGGTSGTYYALLTVGAGGGSKYQLVDIIFNHNGGSGSGADLVADSGNNDSFVRCVFANGRGSGITGAAALFECEAYGNNTSNTASKGGFGMAGNGVAFYCYSHDNTGSNTAGFYATGSGAVQVITNCISDTNGGVAFSFSGNMAVIVNSDAYNNGSDAVKDTAIPTFVYNLNAVKNTGAAINTGTASTALSGFVYNVGYGSGSQANGNADTLNNLTQSGSVTYASGVTPWNAPTTGDFRINLPAANFTGRASYTETDGTNTGTVGYPDIGAAQSLTGAGGTFTKEISAGYGF